MRKLIIILLVLLSATSYGQRQKQLGQPGLRYYMPSLICDTIRMTRLQIASDADSALTWDRSNNTLKYAKINSNTRVIDKQYSPVGNSGTSETDLFTKTIAANTLTADGQSIEFSIDGLFNDATSTGNLKVYFAGTLLGATGALTVSVTSGWTATGWIMRASSTTAHGVVTFTAPGTSTPTVVTYLDFSGLDFTATNVFKITGTAGGAGGSTNDITAKSWVLKFVGI
jgi:hypothetical protein